MYLFHNEILTFVHNLLEKWSLMRINVSAFLRLSETLRSETHVVEAAAEAEREAKQWSGASREGREER